MTMHYMARSGILTSYPWWFSFTSIPSNFTHLQLRWYSRMNSGSYTPTLYIHFNGDTTANNYSCHIFRGDGASATSAAYVNSGNVYAFGAGNSATSTANSFTVGIVDILDYASTNKNKTVRWLGGWDANGSGQAWLTSGFWNNSSTAINSISVYCDGGFADGSHFELYGITSNPLRTGA